MVIINKSDFIVEYFYNDVRGYLKPKETIEVDNLKKFRSNFIDMLEIVSTNKNIEKNLTNKESVAKENNENEINNAIEEKEKSEHSSGKAESINKNINEMSLQELKKLAKELGVNPNLKKTELIKEIKKVKGE